MTDTIARSDSFVRPQSQDEWVVEAVTGCDEREVLGFITHCGDLFEALEIVSPYELVYFPTFDEARSCIEHCLDCDEQTGQTELTGQTEQVSLPRLVAQNVVHRLDLLLHSGASSNEHRRHFTEEES